MDTILSTYRQLRPLIYSVIQKEDYHRLRVALHLAGQNGQLKAAPPFFLNPIEFDLQTALICTQEIALSRSFVICILLQHTLSTNAYSIEQACADFGNDVATILGGLEKVKSLIESHRQGEDFITHRDDNEVKNFTSLLLSFAADMRVVFILIANCVNQMRLIRNLGTTEDRCYVATQASRIYAPLAHKLGLYLIKSELEDLSLKYLNHEVYYMIKNKLSETKKSRDQFIEHFIQPIRQRLEQEGLKFHIKGRTKSIHSIWQKMKKQQCEFEHIYDLFAIRIILDSSFENEKKDCWQVFSIVTDMYRPNPRRLRDWLSVPKPNGYESLHITVMGPEGKWVEIQIRTERMDDIAEHGFAAHWRYKGVKDSGARTEQWLADIRSALEQGDSTEKDASHQNPFKVDLYSEDVFVFTPKGDLFKLPAGATVLDFAYRIHTNVGDHCTGARVGGRNVPIRTTLNNGDVVEVLTQANQQPKPDWLNIAVTTRAKAKIRSSISLQEQRSHQLARETLERRFHNRHVQPEESLLMRLLRRIGYRHINDFYADIANEKVSTNDFVDQYIQFRARENGEAVNETLQHSAAEYKAITPAGVAQLGITNGEKNDVRTEDVSATPLIIGKGDIPGLDYSPARCCNPVFGDEVFAFVTASRGITLHRADCPNANRLRQQMGYRILPAQWAGGSSQRLPVTLHVVGHDDIGIVNNMTSIIAKQPNTNLRSIDIASSEDGLFSGTLLVQVLDDKTLRTLIRKLQNVKGVKSVSR